MAPRIYCIRAESAPILAVFRRGPSDWWHIGRWNWSVPAYEPGAWFKGSLYPRRSDLSPDGRWLCYFALRSASWDVGPTYIALSRLPWLKALAAWPTCGTWTRGFRFSERGSATADIGPPAHGDASPCRTRFDLEAFEAAQFAVELHRGWRERPDSPARIEGDIFDQRRNASVFRAQPGGSLHLVVTSVGWPGGEWTGDTVDGLKVRYWLEDGSQRQALDDAQWADWSDRGALLVATRTGALQIRELREGSLEVVYEQDLAGMTPAPVPAPGWADQW